VSVCGCGDFALSGGDPTGQRLSALAWRRGGAQSNVEQKNGWRDDLGENAHCLAVLLRDIRASNRFS
jgi:hypothetical protein